MQEHQTAGMIADIRRLTLANRQWAERLVDERDTLRAEVERLQARLTESEAENDQWQKKLTEVWAEVERLRAVTPISDFYVIVRSRDRIVTVVLETAERVELALQAEEWADIGAHFRRAWSRAR